MKQKNEMRSPWERREAEAGQREKGVSHRANRDRYVSSRVD